MWPKRKKQEKKDQGEKVYQKNCKNVWLIQISDIQSETIFLASTFITGQMGKLFWVEIYFWGHYLWCVESTFSSRNCSSLSFLCLSEFKKPFCLAISEIKLPQAACGKTLTHWSSRGIMFGSCCYPPRDNCQLSQKR